jgi:hypothetical protein
MITARSAVGDEGGFDQAWKQGRKLTIDGAIEAAFGAAS